MRFFSRNAVGKNGLSKRQFRLESLEDRTLLAVAAGGADSFLFDSAPQQLGAETPSSVVTTLNDIVDSSDGLISLREAISYAGNEGVVTFASSMNGRSITLQNGQITISNTMTIDASSLSSGITIDGNQSRIFFNSDSLELKNITLTGGSAIAGGAVYNNQGYLSMTDCIVTSNNAGMSGAGVYNYLGTFEIFNTEFSGNEADKGGAVWNANGSVYATSCIFSLNCASELAGAIGNGYGDLVLSNCLITDNFAELYYGGGIYNMGNVFLFNCTVANNYAGVYGGGILNDGSKAILTSYNSIIAVNSADTAGNDLYNFLSTEQANAYNTLSSFIDWTESSSTLTYSSSRQLFVSIGTGDYHLAMTAQAINTGDNNNAIDPYGNLLQCDISGLTRIVGSSVDMGAYEYGATDPGLDIKITGYSGVYDGKSHSVMVEGTEEGDVVLYSSDGINYSNMPVNYTNAGSYTVYVSITREGSFSYIETASISIAKRPVTVSIKANDKVYDGTITASGSYTLSGVCTGDYVSLVDGYYQFDTRNAGTNKTVTFRGYSLIGSANYQLFGTTSVTKAAITAKQLNVTGTKVSDKEYDGTTKAEVTVGVVSGVYSGDNINVSAAGEFASPDPGLQDVTVTYSLSGAAAANYLAPPSEILKASITNGSPVDLDGDGFIGPGDRAILSAAWFTAEGDEEWDPVCDIDGDGFVGPGDLSYISINWFKTVDDPTFVNPVRSAELEGEDLFTEDFFSADFCGDFF